MFQIKYKCRNGLDNLMDNTKQMKNMFKTQITAEKAKRQIQQSQDVKVNEVLEKWE